MDGPENIESELLPVPAEETSNEIASLDDTELSDQQMAEDEAFAVIANLKFQEPIDRVKFIAKAKFGRWLTKKVTTPYLTFNVWQSMEEMQQTMLAMGVIARGEPIIVGDKSIVFPQEFRVKAAETQSKLALAALQVAETMRRWNDTKAKLSEVTSQQRGKNRPPNFSDNNVIYADTVNIRDSKSANNGEPEGS